MGRVRHYLRQQATVMADQRQRLLDGEEQSVHDLRVAVRRYRSTLRTFAPLLPGQPTGSLDERLRAWGARLGELRDLEVLAATLVEHGAGDTPLATDLTSRLGAGREELLDELTGADCGHLVGDATSYAQDVAVTRGDVERLVRRAGRTARRRLAEAGDDPTRLHRARKAAKRARYAAEVVGDAEQSRQHAHVQSHLGTHHDCTTALVHLAQAGGSPHTGWLSAELEDRADRARRAAMGDAAGG